MAFKYAQIICIVVDNIDNADDPGHRLEVE